jgi:hypothetical protein
MYAAHCASSHSFPCFALVRLVFCVCRALRILKFGDTSSLIVVLPRTANVLRADVSCQSCGSRPLWTSICTHSCCLARKVLLLHAQGAEDCWLCGHYIISYPDLVRCSLSCRALRISILTYILTFIPVR